MKTSFARTHARALRASNAVACSGTTSTGCMGVCSMIIYCYIAYLVECVCTCTMKTLCSYRRELEEVLTSE